MLYNGGREMGKITFWTIIGQMTDIHRQRLDNSDDLFLASKNAGRLVV